MNRAKGKGDRAELEVQALIRDLLGVPARRKLGAGRLDDMGDIDNVPDTTIQVKSYTDIARAARECIDVLTAQQARSGDTFGVDVACTPRVPAGPTARTSMKPNRSLRMRA